MRTAIMTDSNSGIFEQEGKEIGVFVVPMPVIIDGTTYYEGRDISHSQFFQWLTEQKAVKTSQPAAGDVINLWESILADGYDEILYIPMSSGLSGSCMTAQGLAKEYGNRIEIADNHRISVTLRQAVQEAFLLREQGMSACEIRETLENTAYDSIIYVGVNTLDYLRASGRVTAAGAALATILNLKPLLVIKGEKLDACAKVRGARHCQAKLIELMKEEVQKYERDGAKVQIGAAGSFADYNQAKLWLANVQKAFPDHDVKYDPLTFSISCHTGADAFGMGISKSLEIR